MKFKRGGREAQTGDQELSVISYIDKLDVQTGYGRGRHRRGEGVGGRLRRGGLETQTGTRDYL